MEHASKGFIQQVRQRPGLYVGDTGAYGLHRLPLILLHAGAAAAREGRGDEVSLSLEASGACSFSFNGLLWPRPLELQPPRDVLERLLSLSDNALRAPRPQGAPETCLFSPHEDLAIANALSSTLELALWSEGRGWRQSFREGEPAGPLQAVLEGGAVSPQGTRIRLTPDRSLFEQARWSHVGLAFRMRELAALHEGVIYRLRDEVRGHEESYRFVHGLADLAAQLSAPLLPLHAPWSFEGQYGTTHVRAAFQWCRHPGSLMLSWVNQLRASGGTYLSGLCSGIHAALHHYATASGRASELWGYIPSVLLEGLTVVLEITLPQPVWRGSIKGELANEECEFELSHLSSSWLQRAFAENPLVAEQVLDLVSARYVARG
jgi:DNA gyrase subunit B